MESALLGRFGHHPNPAIDFEIEVEELIGMGLNRQVGFDLEPDLEERVARAMDFRVGGDPSAMSAKMQLRKLEDSLK